MTAPDMTAGRLAALERTLRTVAGDVEAIGYMTGPGAVPLPWYVRMHADEYLLLDPAQQTAIDEWAEENVPTGDGPDRDGVLEVRLVTPRSGYLLIRRYRDADGGSVQTEWVARDDLTAWPL